jgi:protein-disulfide isomerase
MRNGRYVLTGVILMALMAGSIFIIRKIRPMTPASVSETGEKSKGPADAPVQIVVYSDFQCPACQKGEEVAGKMMAIPEYAGKIHMVFRHFPLPNHRWAGLAHQAAECAQKEGKFWEYHDRLYQDQKLWSEQNNPTETFLRYAQELNIPLEAFALCLASPETRNRVLEDQTQGEKLRLQSTPTYFINGERLVGPMELVIQGDALIRKTLKLAPRAPLSPSPAAPISPEPMTPLSPSPVPMTSEPMTPSSPIPAA